MTSPSVSRLSSDLSYVQSEQTIIHERTSLRLDLIVLLFSIGKLIKKQYYLIKKSLNRLGVSIHAGARIKMAIY